MAELIAEILGWYLDVKYLIKHKKRRKFEQENNLPKSIVWHPMTKPLLISFPIFLIIFALISYFNFNNKPLENTSSKIAKIQTLLSSEKKQFGFYPKELKKIIRNNPLHKNITKDYWGNDFIYKISKDSLNYQLVSMGKDQKSNTSDDIKATN
ncbi:type II secretion system protein GspG [Polaribacter vadi]|uniref:type II secretion system protein GspG n=1 Tax=Polaribacter TaxID=52959 RepID=UPI001C083FD5|nr:MULTISPECIES: type II secretion system protein GspG [Polaribacter]MBU3010190.1 type II secretion system protein GspG [Polaribacter vadi]MDO6739997.1 type II secretion system protein GspG [Polaribacter sp. 1_MG-2023]